MKVMPNNHLKGLGGAPPGNQNAMKHGLYSAKKLLAELEGLFEDG